MNLNSPIPYICSNLSNLASFPGSPLKPGNEACSNPTEPLLISCFKIVISVAFSKFLESDVCEDWVNVVLCDQGKTSLRKPSAWSPLLQHVELYYLAPGREGERVCVYIYKAPKEQLRSTN